jgi:hypothetical protein
MTNKEIIEKYERGEYIDHHVTEEELKTMPFYSKEDFEKRVEANELYLLYSRRGNAELSHYFVNKAEFYIPFPVDGIDCIAIEQGD